jgi:hypothetical protein
MKGTYIKVVSRLFLEEIGLSPENAGKTPAKRPEW